MNNASPEFEPVRRPAAAVVLAAGQAVRVRNAYDGAAAGRRAAGWRAPTVTPNAAVLSSLATLRDRSRAAVRNDGYAKGGVDTLVTNIVGTGITMRSKAADPSLRTQIDALWKQWCEFSDADGLLPFEGQQTQIVRAALEGGDAFARLRFRQPGDGLPVPLQVQILEAELVPHTFSQPWGGAKIRAGIEFDAIGRRVAFWFHPSRPELDDFDQGELRRVPADQVIHLFDPLRPGQIRGVPVLTQALLRLYEFDKFDDATLLRQQIANMFAGFVTKPAGVGDVAIDPLSNGEMRTDASGLPFVSLEPGLMQELDPGDDVKFAAPPGPGDNYEAFVRQQLYGAARAVGVPYEFFTGDMSRVNDRTVRVILVEFRRRIMAWQYQVVGYQFCRRVWNAFIDQAVLSGAIDVPEAQLADRESWAAVEWAPNGWPYIHPVQDVQAQREAIRAGLTTRSDVVAEQGASAEDIDQQQADDNARADALGLRYDSDGRFARSGAAASSNTPDSADDDKAAQQGAAA
jgi:lambda family phage portal protein